METARRKRLRDGIRRNPQQGTSPHMGSIHTSTRWVSETVSPLEVTVTFSSKFEEAELKFRL